MVILSFFLPSVIVEGEQDPDNDTGDTQVEPGDGTALSTTAVTFTT